MDTTMGPSLANLFVGFIEHQFFSQYHGPKIEHNGRYIDNCIGATSSAREELTQFITAVSSFHPVLKYTWEVSDSSLAILDIKISIEGNVLCTSVYNKDIGTCCIHLRIHHTSRIPYRAQQIDRQSALQTAEMENTDCIPFTLTFHPQFAAFPYM